MQHGVPLCQELRSRFPLGPFVGMRDTIADREQKIGVFDSAGQIPVGFHLVRRTVVIVSV